MGICQHFMRIVGMRSQILPVVLVLCGVTTTQAQVSIDAFTGTAFNLHTPLSISQEGEADLDFTAHYSTRPMEDTPYFGARVSIWKGDRAFVITLVHHKLYLSNPPPEVAWFRITYGFNMGTVGVAWRRGNLSYTVGAGGVITHASSMVRGKRYLGTGGPLNRGYTFSGVTALASVQYKVPVSRAFYLSGETMASASYIEVSVKDGQAHVPAAALHLHAGFGYSF
jgi:hypothetical protein